MAAFSMQREDRRQKPAPVHMYFVYRPMPCEIRSLSRKEVCGYEMGGTKKIPDDDAYIDIGNRRFYRLLRGQLHV